MLSRIIYFVLGELKQNVTFRLYWKQRQNERPLILGYIFDVIKRVIPRYEKEGNTIQTDHRLADFIVLGEFIAQELGEEKGRFLKIFKAVAEEQNSKAIENNSFAQILIEYILSREFKSSSGKAMTKWEVATTSLLSELVNFATSNNYNISADRDFPKDAVGLGIRLFRLKSTLFNIGIKIEKKKDRANTKWIIEIINNDSTAELMKEKQGVAPLS